MLFHNPNKYNRMSSVLFNLKGKRALITGGTQGIGYAIAKGLGEAGATVIINGRNQERLNDVLREFHTSGFDVKGSLFDITSSESVKDEIDNIEKNLGPIDILVNNAGIIK